MQYSKGGDPQAMRAVAARLRGHEAELRRVRQAGDGAVRGLRGSWGGPDVDRFAREWSASAPRIDRCVTALQEMAKRIDANAGAQERASQASGAIPGLPGVPPLPFTPRGPGAPQGHPAPGSPGPGQPPPKPIPSTPQQRPPEDFADEHRGRTDDPFHRDLARMAVDSYADGHLPAGTDHRQEVPPGWDRATPDQLRSLGLDPDDPVFSREGRDGLQVQVFTDKDGRTVVAYRGTDFDSLPDWGTDVKQGMGGQTQQYTRAMEIGQQVAAAKNGQVIFTGHSLGGGLATAASMATGAPAVTFDAAGVHDHTAAQAAEMRGGGATAASVNAEANTQNVHYHVDGDPLTDGQRLGHMVDPSIPTAQGQQVTLPGPTLADRTHGGIEEAGYQVQRNGLTAAAIGAADGALKGAVFGPAGMLAGAAGGAAHGVTTVAGAGFGIGFGGYAHGTDAVIERMDQRYPG